MAINWVDTIKKLPVEEIEAVIRLDQHSPAFRIIDWEVSSLSVLGFDTPEGLFAISGRGEDEQGMRPWSVVLKVMESPAEEQNPQDLRYWKRDFLAYQSGLLAQLPGPVQPPRCYGVKEIEKAIWIWMEHIHEDWPHPWNMDQFAFAARQAGRFNGRYLVDVPTPDVPWLSNRPISSWHDGINLAAAWENPYVRKYLPERDRLRVIAVWNERELFLQALTQVPNVFAHGDFQPRNLLIRANAQGRPELVAIDWALCGCYPLGAELVPLVSFALQFREIMLDDMKKLEDAVMAAYLEGLRDVGWAGSLEIVRLGYQIYILMSWGVGLPGNLARNMQEEFIPLVERFYAGLPIDEMLTSAAFQFAHILDFADQVKDRIGK